MEAVGKVLLGSLGKSSEFGFDQNQPFDQKAYEQKKADIFNASSGNLHETDGYECAACKNRGYIAEVAQNETFGYYSEVLRPCKCQRARSAIRRLQASGLQDVVKKYTFALYETPDDWQKKIKESAMRFCDDPENKWFFMGGQSGAGKSHLCTAIAVSYIRKGEDVRYMVWRDEIDRLKGLTMENPELYAQKMDEIKNAPVLYIDDLFKEPADANGHVPPPSGADARRAFELINYRYNSADLTTIISCERTLPDLIAIDEALAGRIAEKTKEAGYLINLKRDSSRNWRLKGVTEI